MLEVTYVGPHDGVDVCDADGRTLATVPRGESAKFPDDVARSLLEQGDAHWLKTAKGVK